MSSSIWTRCGGSSNFLRYSSDVWRVVEAQHLNSTRKLVDSNEEQHLLEDLVEESKPPLKRGTESLHYLLSTPFRYPPLRHGSRYRRRFDPGVWYGAEQLATCWAEVAYYKFIFLDGTDAELTPLELELSAFAVPIACHHAVDVSAAPFDKHKTVLTSKTNYQATQALGAAMREGGTHVVRYPSARDPEGGACIGIFDPVAFDGAPKLPAATYHCTATRATVEFPYGEGAESFKPSA